MPVRRRAAPRFFAPRPARGCRSPVGLASSGQFRQHRLVAAGLVWPRGCRQGPVLPVLLFQAWGNHASVSPGHAVGVGGTCLPRLFVSQLLFDRTFGLTAQAPCHYRATPLPTPPVRIAHKTFCTGRQTPRHSIRTGASCWVFSSQVALRLRSALHPATMRNIPACPLKGQAGMLRGARQGRIPADTVRTRVRARVRRSIMRRR